MTDLYNHECYEGFLKGELNVKIHVSFSRVSYFNILTGVKALAARVKPVNIPICHPGWTVMVLIPISSMCYLDLKPCLSRFGRIF